MRACFLCVFVFSFLWAARSQPAHMQGDIIVARDRSGHFRSVQAAIDSVPDNSTTPIRIYIKPGKYFEKILVPRTKTNIHFIGENKANTILFYDDYAGRPLPGGGEVSTGTSYSVKIQGNDFYATNIRFQNSARIVSQAVALHVVADRAAFVDCDIIGNQDTICADLEGGRHSRQYYHNCYIEGTTDFIFGGATALFENCALKSFKNSYITAASTPETQNFGYVFKNCSLSASPTTTNVYLGRPWRPFAKTVYLHTSMGSHINPAGWHNWNNPDNEMTAYYAEYATDGVDVSRRVNWSRQLTEDEASQYTTENVLYGEDGVWIPPK